MKQIFSVLLLFSSLSITGQEFSFSMYFEDAVGNKDTLVLGYDFTATEGINPQFGEENILHEPFLRDLDVRTGLFTYYPVDPDSFLTKKHIMPESYFTGQFPMPGYIYIYCKYFPLRVSWDPVFNGEWNQYSFITDWNPGGWFDAGNGGEQGPFFMKDATSVTFDHLNIYGFNSIFHKDTVLIQFNDVNLNVLYYSIWYSPTFNSIKKILTGDIIIYPNPVKDLLYVQTCGSSEFESAQILDLSGRILIRSKAQPIQVSTMQKGAYILKVRIKNSTKVFVQKFYKLK